MKTYKISSLFFFLIVMGSLWITSCKKDSTTTQTNSTSATSQQVAQLQNSDAQDAVAEKTEEDIDNQLEELQANNFSASTTKAAIIGLKDTVVITVDHPDTIYFPKVVTLMYYSYQDSSANESITKNGEITITINRPDAKHPGLVTRAFTFLNFAVTTDSTTVILNGTRTVNRTKNSVKLTGLEKARIAVTDNITAALKYTVATTGKTDSLKYTRNVTRQRTAISHYKNINFKAGNPIYNLSHLRYKHEPSLDSLTYTGTVSGINEKGDSYAKIITSPLIIKNYKGSPVTESGTISYTVGSVDSYQITFKQDPAHMHLTLVTVTNNTTGKSKSFDRRFSHKFTKWW